MIVTLTPNPSLDRTVTLPGPLLRGAVNRLDSVTVEPGGKGVNVARVLAASGQQATALVPAAPGDPLLKAIESLGLAGLTCRAVPVAGAARINTAVTEPDGTTTKLNESGAGLSEAEIAAIEGALSEEPSGFSVGSHCRSPGRCRRVPPSTGTSASSACCARWACASPSTPRTPRSRPSRPGFRTVHRT